MTDVELSAVLAAHAKWLKGDPNGIRADLSWTDLGQAVLRETNLSGAILIGADLTDAVLRETNLTGSDLRETNLTGADLRGADLREADLSGARLIGADLSGADLMWANLSEANLNGADLRDANLDFASWPLHCGSFYLDKTDDRLTSQLVHHALHVARANDSDYGKAVQAALLPLQKFHEYREDVERLKRYEHSR